MYRNETIVTKIRPIKKLCIIEEDDINRFIQIIKVYSQEIAGILNRVLINDEKLYSNNTIDFITYFDPDIIINYSTCENNKLESIFKTLVIDGKKQDFDLKRLATPLNILDNISDIVDYPQHENTGSVFTNFDAKTSEENMIYYLNFGIVNKELAERLSTMFKNTQFEEINLVSIQKNTLDPVGRLLNLLSDNFKNFLYLSLRILWPLFTESISINENDHNANGYYTKATIIFGHKNDIKSMTYFWNVRATYPYSGCIWLPIELLDKYAGYPVYMNKFQNYCIFFNPEEQHISELKQKIKDINNSLIEVDNAKYYFRRRSNEWEIFKNKHVVSIIDNRFTVKHPNDKLFSKSGFNINTVLEIYGIEELVLPKSPALGKIFKEPEDQILQPRFNSTIQTHLFSRISSKGLSFAFDEFEPYRQSPLIYDVFLPEKDAIFKALFEEHQLDICDTDTSFIAEQVINLVNGMENLEIFSDESVFELMVRLTPKRIERIAKDIFRNIDETISEARVEELLCRNMESINIINSNIIIDAKNLLSMFNHPDKSKRFTIIETLYKNNILLRGKSFKCPYCNSALWYSLSALDDDMKCYCCGNSVRIPIFSGTTILEDSFRLNELLCNAIDQGILPLLLTGYFLFRQNFCGKRFLFDRDIYDKNKKENLCEIDIIINIGTLIGLAEVKADRGFENKSQIDRILDLSKRINVDFVLFSTLKSKDSHEVLDLIDYLKSKKRYIQTFILTKEMLFERDVAIMHEYTKNFILEDQLPKYPILIEKKKQDGVR